MAVAMEEGGARQLIPVQSCSHQRQKHRVRVDKIKLLSSKKVEKQGSCDPVINDTCLVTGLSRSSFQRRELSLQSEEMLFLLLTKKQAFPFSLDVK